MKISMDDLIIYIHNYNYYININLERDYIKYYCKNNTKALKIKINNNKICFTKIQKTEFKTIEKVIMNLKKQLTVA